MEIRFMKNRVQCDQCTAWSICGVQWKLRKKNINVSREGFKKRAHGSWRIGTGDIFSNKNSCEKVPRYFQSSCPITVNCGDLGKVWHLLNLQKEIFCPFPWWFYNNMRACVIAENCPQLSFTELLKSRFH